MTIKNGYSYVKKTKETQMEEGKKEQYKPIKNGWRDKTIKKKGATA